MTIDLKVLNRNLEWLKTTGQKYDAKLHDTAVMCLAVASHESVGLGGSCNGEYARRLVVAMGKSARTQTLIDWLHAYSNIRIRKDAKADGGYSVGMIGPDLPKMFKDGDTILSMYHVAKDKPFWTAKEKTDGEAAFDLDKRLASMLTAARKAVTAGKGGDNAAMKLAILDKAMADIKAIASDSAELSF